MKNWGNLTNQIIDIVSSHELGIKSQQIAELLNVPYNSVSATLSSLKKQKLVYNKLTLWYFGYSEDNIEPKQPNKVNRVKNRLIDISDDTNFDRAWAEGYLSALADNKLINENEFEVLLNWVKKMSR